MIIPELHQHILKYIQGVFSEADMAILKEEIEKLKPGDVYVEIGVDEGRSARVAHEYAHPDVYKIFIDIHDPQGVEGITIGRAKWMEQEGMVGLGKKGFYVHGDADEFANLFYETNDDNTMQSFMPFVNLLFIDGSHDYESVKKNTLKWENLVKYPGGVILFHDYDHPDVKRWLDEHYGDNKEIFHNKMVKVQK